VIDGQGGREQRENEPFEEPLQDDPNRAVEEAEPYFPPTDPVVTPGADTEVLGGFEATSMSGDGEAPPRASDGRVADEALATRIRRELREDSATTHLAIQVDVTDGVATLRGTVDDLTDTDNALEVAGRVPGVEDVIDEMEMTEPA
jgi:hypothetical protein